MTQGPPARKVRLGATLHTAPFLAPRAPKVGVSQLPQEHCRGLPGGEGGEETLGQPPMQEPCSVPCLPPTGPWAGVESQHSLGKGVALMLSRATGGGPF